MPSVAQLTDDINKDGNDYECCVLGCDITKKRTGLTFFSFPEGEEMCHTWLDCIGRRDLRDLGDYTRFKVCSKHFAKEALAQWAGMKLYPDALPTKHVPPRPHHREDKPGYSDIATQTNITYVNEETRQRMEIQLYSDLLEILFFNLDRSVDIPMFNSFVEYLCAKRFFPGAEEAVMINAAKRMKF